MEVQEDKSNQEAAFASVPARAILLVIIAVEKVTGRAIHTYM